MSGSLLTAVIYSGIPTVVSIVATVIATVVKPGGRVRSGLLHFAAGVVMAVVAVELLPDVVKGQSPVWVGTGFTAGVVLMLIVRRLDKRSGPLAEEKRAREEVRQRQERHTKRGKLAKQPQWPVGLLAGAAVDQVVSGILLGLGIAAGKKTGVLLSFAMTTEDLTFGLAIATILGAVGISRFKTIMTSAALGILFVIITVAASFLPGHSPVLKSVALSFGSAALLFVVTEQLLVEAHHEEEAPLLTASFFAGFLLLLILDMLNSY